MPFPVQEQRGSSLQINQPVRGGARHGGYRWPCDVAAQAFQFIPFMGPGGDTGMQRKAGYCAHRVRAWVVRSAVRRESAG